MRDLLRKPPECGCGWGAENYWAGGKLDEQVVVGWGSGELPTSHGGCCRQAAPAILPQEAGAVSQCLLRPGAYVPCGAGAQAPICRAGVFLLTLLKLWDLEHALGCRGAR